MATAFLSWRVTDGGRISRMLLIVLSWASFIFAVVLVRTGLSVAEFCVLVVLGLAWVVVYATALSGHDKAGPFHGGAGTANAAFGSCSLSRWPG